jgi:nucleotidyltransferase substrate binding protein (TIGR01987 family)
MKKELEYSLKNLSNALEKLEEGLKKTKDQLDKDGVIQRFEFTFELLWKTLKLFLEYQGIEAKTPRSSFKEAFKIGIIKDEELALDMLEDRNRTSHVYNKKIAGEIFNNIKNKYTSQIISILEELKRVNIN